MLVTTTLDLSGCQTSGTDVASVDPTLIASFDGCTDAIAQSSLRHGATRVQVTKAGDPVRMDSHVDVPLTVSIAYRNRAETREADVRCAVDHDGRVIALV